MRGSDTPSFFVEQNKGASRQNSVGYSVLQVCFSRSSTQPTHVYFLAKTYAVLY